MDKLLIQSLACCRWTRDHLNILITEPAWARPDWLRPGRERLPGGAQRPVPAPAPDAAGADGGQKPGFDDEWPHPLRCRPIPCLTHDAVRCTTYCGLCVQLCPCRGPLSGWPELAARFRRGFAAAASGSPSSAPPDRVACLPLAATLGDRALKDAECAGSPCPPAEQPKDAGPPDRPPRREPATVRSGEREAAELRGHRKTPHPHRKPTGQATDTTQATVTPSKTRRRRKVPASTSGSGEINRKEPLRPDGGAR